MQVKGLLVALLSGIITYAVGISLAVGHATLDRGIGVRIPAPQHYKMLSAAPVAQLDRASDFGSEG